MQSSHYLDVANALLKTKSKKILPLLTKKDLFSFNDKYTLYFTIDTSINKAFNITSLNKGTAPTDLVIDWGDNSVTTYDDLMEVDLAAYTYIHNYTENNIYTITFSGSIKNGYIDQYLNASSVKFVNNPNIISIKGNVFIYIDNSHRSSDLYVNTIFKNNINLKTIDKDIFKIATNIADFGECFSSCTSLQNIPEDLFRYNTEAITFTGCFKNCRTLLSIPENLFSHNPLITNFHNCFNNNWLLENIPENLFRYNPLISIFNGCFSSCLILSSIPENLFKYNVNATKANNVFDKCATLTSIPLTLFDNNPNLTEVSYCFRDCINITSAVPDLWNKDKWPNITKFTGCFSGCTKAANYTQIPSGWK